MRIVHCSDVHLDRAFVALDPDAARQRRLDLRAAFERIVALAQERRADAITIGGDLWEDEHVTGDTRQFVAHVAGRARVPVLIAPGNHDPLVDGGHYTRTAWPSHVRIFDRETPHEARFGDVSVWGVAWLSGHLDLGWLQDFHVPADGRMHLLLMHGSAARHWAGATPGEQAPYAPFDPEDVARCGFRLCLAGHYHVGSHAGGVVYPGSPEPLGWGETGRHTAAVIDAGLDAFSVELVDTGRLSYLERAVDCEGALSGAEVGERLAAALDDARAETACVRVSLTGQVGVECEIDVEVLAAAHRGRYAAIDVRDATEPAFDLDGMAARSDAAGHFVRALRRLADDATAPREREKLRIALEAGLHALDGRRQVARVD